MPGAFDTQYPKYHADPNRVDVALKMAIGASGAPGAITGTSGFAFTRTGAGTYTFTYPKCPDINLVGSTVDSGAAAVSVSFTALNPSAGTGTMVTRAPGGAAADVSSGGSVSILGTVQYTSI